MTLTRRTMSVKFTLGTGDFGAGGENTVELSGYRMSANIQKTGGAAMSTLELRVWGVPLDVMQRLTVLNKLAFSQERSNTVTVFAGNEGTTPTAVFSGTIKEAWADASAPPDMLFVVSAFTGGLDAVKPVPPTSYSGPVDVATLLAGIGALMTPERAVENSGVSFVWENPYLPGTPMQQLRKIAIAANCNMVVDEAAIAIWPLGSARGDQSLLVSAGTGLVGYPQFTQSGVSFRMLFNPALVFGQRIEIQSVLGAANGTWVIAALAHTLEAEMPGGQWFTEVECGLLGYAAPIIGTI